MPLKEYQCRECNKVFEDLYHIDRAPYKVTCKYCGGVAVKKAISTFAFKVVGGTPRNLTAELRKDEVDRTMDEYESKRKIGEEKNKIRKEEGFYDKAWKNKTPI